MKTNRMVNVTFELTWSLLIILSLQLQPDMNDTLAIFDRDLSN